MNSRIIYDFLFYRYFFYFANIIDPKKGSGTNLYTFGWHQTFPTIAALKTGGESTFYSSEMKISVMDNRIVPIGWSAWANVDADGNNRVKLL